MANENNGIDQSVIDNAQISAIANAEPETKAAMWADKIETESLVILESRMGNYESWNSSFRNELMKRDCLDTVKFYHNPSDKASVVANKNVTLFLKKSVNSSLLQMIEDKSAYKTYKELVDMAPNKSSIMRAILAEATTVSTHDMNAYVVEHQDIHSRLMKADPMGTAEASTHPAHMDRLLDGLSTEQQLAMNYLFSTWEDRSKATAKDVFKVGLKLTSGLGNNDGILAGSAAFGKNQGKPKNNTDKCPKHPYLFHKWAKCDLNPNTADPIGRDKRKAIKLARTASGENGYKQGQGYKVSKDDEIKALKAQLAAATIASKVDPEPNAECPVAMFAALRSILETIAASEVNGPASDTHYTTAPRNIIDSGASMSFVRNLSSVTNPTKHVRSLITAEGNTINSTHLGKLQLTDGRQPIFVSALVVPSFKDNLVTV